MKLVILILGLCSLLLSEVLTISFSRSASEPYVFIDKRELKGGVLKELMDALSKQSGIKVKYVLVSKRNQEEQMVQGSIDGSCLVNPSELANPDAHLWSEPLYEEEDVLIIRKSDANKINNLHALFGHKIGTRQAHHYPTLTHYFKTKKIERIENKKLANNINQLRFGIIDAAVDTKLAVGHCIQKKDVADDIIVSSQVIDKQVLYCAFRKDMDVSLDKINAALASLKQKGVIDKILKKYRADL